MGFGGRGDRQTNNGVIAMILEILKQHSERRDKQMRKDKILLNT